MIEAQDLTKHYGNFAAAEKVSFQIPKGQVAGFLGPNGAGKSTTMKMLTGYLAPTGGSARIGNHDVGTDRLEAAKLLGYLPENGPLYTEMTPASFLKNLGEARGMKRAQIEGRLEYVANKCDLKSVWGKMIGKLSKGFRQRVGMAQAILHDPEVLILDEPTSGLDPNQVVGVRELILSLGETKTILLSTHILQEVAAVCSRVVLINNGRIVFDGPTSEMGENAESMEHRFHELTGAAVV
ncbi:MAG: ATP-binding cassette domain-containing protein [Planctomycetaceae bacterium]|nr:ATP-binding cassette domain-containing protein [Planctomycetaceae bacterium]